jgi:hypothetical protein
MNQHPHAEVLRAIADGVPLSEFEASSSEWPHIDHQSMDRWIANVVLHPGKWTVFRKPQHIMVNGFKVPKPLDGSIRYEEAWIPDFERDGFVFCYRNQFSVRRVIDAGCAHATKEAATAHAKAMLGIDPEYFK